MTNTTTSLWNNRYFAIAAVQRGGTALKHVSKALQKDTEIVSFAVAQNKQAIIFASEDLQIKYNVENIDNLSSDNHERNKRERKLYTGHVGYLRRGGDSTNFETVLAAVKLNGHLLAEASPQLQANYQIVLAAVNQNGEAIVYASQKLKSNREIIMATVNNNGNALHNFPKKIVDDVEVVLAAINNCSSALRHASSRLKKDNGFILAAVKVNPLIINRLDNSVIEDTDFITEVINFYHTKYINDKQAKQNFFPSQASTLGSFSDITIFTQNDTLPPMTSQDQILSPSPADLMGRDDIGFESNSPQPNLSNTLHKRKASSDLASQEQVKRPKVGQRTASDEQGVINSQELLQLASMNLPANFLVSDFFNCSDTMQPSYNTHHPTITHAAQFNPVNPNHVKLTLDTSKGKHLERPNRRTKPSPQTRTVSGTTNTSGVADVSEILTPEVTNQIGRWGEEVVYCQWFTKRYAEKYSHYEKENTDKGFILTKDNMTVEVQWHNKGLPLTKYTTHDCDIEIVKKNNQGEEIQHKYIEVKTTRADKGIMLNFPPNEVSLMRECKNEQKISLNKYRLFKVFNAGQENVRIEKENDPYKRHKAEAGFVVRG